LSKGDVSFFISPDVHDVLHWLVPVSSKEPTSIVVHKRGLKIGWQNLSWMSSLVLRNYFLLKKEGGFSKTYVLLLVQGKIPL